MLLFLLKLLLALSAGAILLGILRTWQMEHSADQAIFAAGTAPSPAPHGFYSGAIAGPHVSWLGKTFYAAQHTGINEFDAGRGTKTENFPFKTQSNKGLTDKNLYVLDIDYNIPANPFWVRPILDELVQTAPDTYLGKLQLRLIPGLPFTLIFFRLSR